MPGMGESAQMAAHSAAGSCHKGPSGASTRAGRKGPKIVKTGAEDRDIRQFDKFGPYSGSRSRPERPDCGSRRPVEYLWRKPPGLRLAPILVMPGPIPGMLSSHESTPYQVLRFRMT